MELEQTKSVTDNPNDENSSSLPSLSMDDFVLNSPLNNQEGSLKKPLEIDDDENNDDDNLDDEMLLASERQLKLSYAPPNKKIKQ